MVLKTLLVLSRIKGVFGNARISEYFTVHSFNFIIIALTLLSDFIN